MSARSFAHTAHLSVCSALLTHSLGCRFLAHGIAWYLRFHFRGVLNVSVFAAVVFEAVHIIPETSVHSTKAQHKLWRIEKTSFFLNMIILLKEEVMSIFMRQFPADLDYKETRSLFNENFVKKTFCHCLCRNCRNSKSYCGQYLCKLKWLNGRLV